MGDLKKLFNPETIALIGATEEEGTVGRAILRNLLLPNNRKIFAVNPHRQTVLDLPCYPGIARVPEKVDLSIIATPPPTVPGILDECGKAEIEGAIIISSGLKNLGKKGGD